MTDDTNFYDTVPVDTGEATEVVPTAYTPATLLDDLIPKKYRRYVIYAPYALAGVVLTVMNILGVDTATANEVYVYLGVAFGATSTVATINKK